MERLHIKFIKWISNKFGYKIAMIKISSSSGLKIEGDKELLRYVDITGYSFKKEPLKRTYPKFIEPEPIKPLTTEQLKELGITPNS
jgi:hypothetical protein